MTARAPTIARTPTITLNNGVGLPALGLEQLDLLLLHQPLSSAFDRTLGAYRALEALLAAGCARSA